jgi:hypothetical protein
MKILYEFYFSPMLPSHPPHFDQPIDTVTYGPFLSNVYVYTV